MKEKIRAFMKFPDQQDHKWFMRDLNRRTSKSIFAHNRAQRLHAVHWKLHRKPMLSK